MYIKAYSEPMAFSGIFRTVDIFSQFQIPVDTRRRFNVYKTSYRPLLDVETTLYVYWNTTQEQFMNILNLNWTDSDYLELWLI